MTKRTRFVSAACAIVIVATTALIGATDLNPAALAQQAKTASIAADDLFTGPNSADFRVGGGFGVNRADGGVEASGEWPVTPASAQATLHLKLTLHRTQK